MTIIDRDTADKYNAAISGELGDRAEWVAKVTDRLMGELRNGYEEAGLRFPGDDRCFNLECAIFKVALEANSQ